MQAASLTAQRPGTGVVGRPLAHESAHLHVSGEARYVDDLPLPEGTLHAAIGYAPCAHARLVQLDLTPVLACPEVVAVFTARDIPGENNYGSIVHDDPLLASGEIAYWGQPLFLVVARSHGAARKAARQARIEFEVLPAILTVEEAMRAGSDVLPPVEVRRGEPEAALERAPHRLSGQLACGGQEHFYLEGQVAVALPEEDGQMRVLSSTQHPSEVQAIVARALARPSAMVRVECRRIGGGFGGKESQPALFAALAAVAADRLGRPVKLRLDRDDDFVITGKRHPFAYDYTVGFDERGRILVLVATLMSDCGYSADLSGPVADRALAHVDNAYFLEHVHLKSYRLKTHKASNTAFRGFGGPQGMFLIEHVIDAIARRLGLDPLSVRTLNFYGQRTRNMTHYGQRVEAKRLHTIVPELARRADYAARRREIEAHNARFPIVRRGIALTPVKFGISFNSPHLNQAGALVHLYLDGSVLVNHGGTEMGQGLYTKVQQVVAEELGLSRQRVRVSAADTSKVANTSATAASSGSDLNGMAAREACRAIRLRLAAFLAEHWGCPAEALRFCADGVEAQLGDELKRWSIEQVIERAYLARVPLWAAGFYKTPKIHWDRERFRGRPFYYFAFGAAVSEVAVDTLTGETRLLRVDILHDCGRSLNPALDRGQIEGAFVQGMGWLTSEELVWGRDGRLLTHAPSTYKIPTAGDVPPVFNVWLLDDAPNAEETIYRSKAVGEPPLMLALSVHRAIVAAIAGLAPRGTVIRLDAPATPERVLSVIEALRDRRAGCGPFAEAPPRADLSVGFAEGPAKAYSAAQDRASASFPSPEHAEVACEAPPGAIAQAGQAR
ncbi:MAG: xanthine dehydrogenase molybdopterin binding subunit [Casimicrobiaceae bacterium]|nr:xanthine dehydrogenase molybdopterin binding subunit [Casimicrobiaceae bacterium]